MGALPDWYTLLRAARYLQVAPWELLAQPQVWQEWALTAESAENEAMDEVRKRSQSKAKGKR
jgi:hypothetical protein